MAEVQGQDNRESDPTALAAEADLLPENWTIQNEKFLS